jgi:hypothetical protein
MTFEMRDLAGLVFQQGPPASEVTCMGNTQGGDEGDEQPCENTRPGRGTGYGEPPLDALRRQLRARLA